MRSVKRLVGYILPPKSENVDEESDKDDDEEEETVPEFLDMNEMDAVSSGAFNFQQSVPASDEVDFMFDGKKERVKGRFPLRNPWWKISCNAQSYTRKLVVNGYPAYELRTDLKNDWRAIISLFLKECMVNDTFVVPFMEWLPKDRYMDLRNLEEAVYEFGESSHEAKQVSNYVITQISKSDAAFNVRVSTTYPYIMKYLPTLLPGQFLNLLQKGREEEEKQQAENDKENNMDASPHKHNKVPLLARLEELIKTEVWKFGFGYIMYKEFRLVRCETTLKNFMSCELFTKMSTVQQNALKVYNELKNYCSRFGHTYIERKFLDERMKMPEVRVWDAVAFLRQHKVLNVEKGKIALKNLYNYEKEIAECLQKLIEREPWKIDLDVREVLLSAARERMRDPLTTTSCSTASEVNREDKSGLSGESASDVHEHMDEIPESTLNADIALDPDQVRAAEMMCANAVTVISGKGGCGKTYVVSTIFKAAMEQQEDRKNNDRMLEEGERKENDTKPVEVLLTAPTGRAASLLSKKTCFTAYTMHQVLWNYKLTKKDENGNPLKWKFGKVRVLVVDEGSLVCVQLLSSILLMLTKHAQLQKFIILGDIRQLPSIKPGNVLNDLFTSLKKMNWAIEMCTNHRAESKLIVENAGLIADMGVSKKFHHLNYDATVELRKAFALPSPEKRFIEILLPANEIDDDLQNSIKSLLNGPASGLKDDTNSQFIAFTRKQCALINELCCKHYSNHTTKTCDKKMNFQIGDKVCCTRNGYVTDKDKEDEAKCKNDDMYESKVKKERLCNGEIFFITQDVTIEEAGQKRSKRRYLTLDNRQDRKLTVNYRELMRECKLQHAWARTIHTFQGSEEKTIVYVLDSGKGQTWKHVYTAVTRGQNRVYVIVKQGGLENAIRGHVIRRNTRLDGLVAEMLNDFGGAKKYFLSQPSQSQFNTPKRGSFQSAHESSSSPGPSQACCFSSPKLASPSPSKRESVTDNSTTPSKKLKVDTPLGSSQLMRLSLNTTPRQLFPEAPQSHQDQ
ncbi:DNA helicase B [Tachysurus fulvidraco]|uniref:DNA helicase B n=1 Tax=Tachysurus fulvidraco TaxID=1234273 RepID=UPI000F4E3BCC|nr:DNA helicase B [Tachysurus fulvidraco]XP_027007575.1 DNA helicase B [Tachysurus fulvidraco]